MSAWYEHKSDQTSACDHMNPIINLQNDFSDVDLFCTMRKGTKQPHPPEYILSSAVSHLLEQRKRIHIKLTTISFPKNSHLAINVVNTEILQCKSCFSNDVFYITFAVFEVLCLYFFIFILHLKMYHFRAVFCLRKHGYQSLLLNFGSCNSFLSLPPTLSCFVTHPC